ncbi:sodium:calcium antiporter [Candidatus Uhrbacteria bacterium]|nr:sodium:calcium antiporter [Candidatus Uhrbacteria bacterium]
MSVLNSIIILGLLFYGLSRSADIVVVRVRGLGERLGFSPMLLGVPLGILTSMPEIAIAINAAKENIIGVSLGNLLGGIPVLMGFILGASAIANRRISTSDGRAEAPYLAAYLFLPVLLGLDGVIGAIDGLLLIALYLVYLGWLYVRNGSAHAQHRTVLQRGRAKRQMLIAIASVIAVVLFSNMIVDVTRNLLRDLAVPAFFVGLLLFSVGTNLPEISVAFRSWRRGTAELSLGHLFGSTAANPLIIGIIGFLRPSPMPTGPAYFAFTILLAGLLATMVVFVRSGRRLTAREGVFLLAWFAAIGVSQVMLLPLDME